MGLQYGSDVHRLLFRLCYGPRLVAGYSSAWQWSVSDSVIADSMKAVPCFCCIPWHSSFPPLLCRHSVLVHMRPFVHAVPRAGVAIVAMLSACRMSGSVLVLKVTVGFLSVDTVYTFCFPLFLPPVC